jgi:trehalose-phosphatase
MLRSSAGSGGSDSRWCLFLDVDGTLLEIAPTPDAVRVEPSLKELLLRVQQALGGAVALVSGRSLATLDELFAPVHWPAAGLHGLERRDAVGVVHSSGPAGPGLADARVALSSLAERSPGTLLEDKGTSLALHYRAVPELEAVLRREMRDIAAPLGGDYHVLEGKRVLELKPASVTKDVVRSSSATTSRTSTGLQRSKAWVVFRSRWATVSRLRCASRRRATSAPCSRTSSSSRRRRQRRNVESTR